MFARSQQGQTAGGRTRWAALGAVLAIAVSGAVQVATAADPPASAGFFPITPCRLMDTRPAPATVGPRNTPLAAAETVTVQVSGTNGNCTLPAGIDAVAMNVTVAQGTAQSFLTVWPADVARPNASNLNWRAGDGATPNKVDVKVSATGAVKLFNNAGTVNIIADVVGYYTEIAGPTAQECAPPFLQVGVDEVGDIVCNSPTDDDNDGFGEDPWETADPPIIADCDDTDAAINPDAIEISGNTIDENCDNADFTVEECDDNDPYTLDQITPGGECDNMAMYADVDGDGSNALIAVGGEPDCDDTNDAIYPDATEIGGNQIDENCDGILITIEDCDDGNPYTNDFIDGATCVNTPTEADADGDGFTAETATDGFPDCNDTDDAINPDAIEITDNAIDDNCNGQIDET